MKTTILNNTFTWTVYKQHIYLSIIFYILWKENLNSDGQQFHQAQNFAELNWLYTSS